MAIREYAPQGYWLGNKYIFDPVRPAYPVQEPMAAENVAAPRRGLSLMQYPRRRRYLTNWGDTGPIGNTQQGWAQNVQDNHSALLGAITNTIGGLFGGKEGVIDSETMDSLYDPTDAGALTDYVASAPYEGVIDAPPGDPDSDTFPGEGPTPASTAMARAQATRGGVFPRPDVMSPDWARSYKTTAETPEYDKLGDRIPEGYRDMSYWEKMTSDDPMTRAMALRDTYSKGFSFMPGGVVLGGLASGTRAGPQMTGDPHGTVYGKNFLGEYRFGAKGPMGTIQAPYWDRDWSPGFEVANDAPGRYGMGTVGNTGISRTGAMFASDGLGKFGPWGYGYGIKQDGTIGALTAWDVNDLDGITDQLQAIAYAGVDDMSAETAEGTAVSAQEVVDYAAEREAAQDAADAAMDDPDGWSPDDGAWGDYHEGGFVEGPDPEVEGEEFTAEMLEGEYVVRPEAVELINNIFGEDFLDRLNALANDQ